MLQAHTGTLHVMYMKSIITWDRYKKNVWEDKLRSEITIKYFVKQLCSVKVETSFFLDALDFWLDWGIRQNIIRQLLQWAIMPKFSSSKKFVSYGNLCDNR